MQQLTYAAALSKFDADANDNPDFKKVRGKVRRHVSMKAHDWIEKHPEYTNKDDALAAFKAECLAANAPPDSEVKVVGFGILVMILVSLGCFFFERWWARTHPNV